MSEVEEQWDYVWTVKTEFVQTSEYVIRTPPVGTRGQIQHALTRYGRIVVVLWEGAGVIEVLGHTVAKYHPPSFYKACRALVGKVVFNTSPRFKGSGVVGQVKKFYDGITELYPKGEQGVCDVASPVVEFETGDSFFVSDPQDFKVMGVFETAFFHALPEALGDFVKGFARALPQGSDPNVFVHIMCNAFERQAKALRQ